jgi:hypothetical protein
MKKGLARAMRDRSALRTHVSEALSEVRVKDGVPLTWPLPLGGEE